MKSLFLAVTAAALGASALASTADSAVQYSPYVAKNNASNVYWGDTHLHTKLSMDAGAFGNRLGLEEAYTFAKGGEVTSTNGQRTRLSRPLDFLVAADHSDGMGFFDMLETGAPEMMGEEVGRRWNKMLGDGEGGAVALELISMFSQGIMPWETNDPELMTPVWNEVVDAAEKHNDPGVFTAFIGYEWTSLIKGNNLHRVVIYRDDGDKTRGHLPYTLADSADAEDLWANLASYEKKTGGSVLAIPHNGNLSNGMMFADVTVAGEAYDKDYLQRRKRWEPLYEITQIKGDGEAHPFLSPDDEFADYETWDFGNLDLSVVKTNDMLKYEYAREALKRGLEYQAKHGVNPFEFGVIGSTDSHTSLATAEEDNFFGKHAGSEPSANRAMHKFMSNDNGTIYSWQEVSSGYAAVWAQENTRASLWDAMMRRETYGTTGSRMTIRLFGGWEYTLADARNPNLAAVGYAKGVPMGGELGKRSSTLAPSFLVAASRDPIGGNLDRIQIVKGWYDAKGGLQEKVYNVAWGGKRQLDKHGKLPAVGSTVNVAMATWENTIGASDLATVWRDPDFDPKAQAFYYARVIEIPTPRWTAYDANRFGVKLPENVPMTTQERGYTSPIWYTP
ncbi:MAG: DUF3604 domain-containing protein [Proteobacteria bacterium]|nr:DUF3604 domain-containing protein [Pseudomonadota bacterium]